MKNRKLYRKILNERIKNLKKEQREVFDIMQRESPLQLCYVCGFGKGYILNTDLLNGIVNRNSKYYAILSHRIALNEQHIEDVFSLFAPMFGEVAFAFIGYEGGINLNDFDTKTTKKLNSTLFRYNRKTNQNITEANLIITTTSKVVLDKFIANNQNRKIIFVSTYHSADLLDGIDIDTLYCDEAHKLASNFEESYVKNGQKSFKSNYEKITHRRRFFFAATPKDSSENSENTFLMNNQKIFGRRLYISHIDSVRLGYIVPCSVIRVCPEDYNYIYNQNFDSVANKAHMVHKSFIEHEIRIKKKSSNPNKIAGKLLIRCSSVRRDMWPLYFELTRLCPEIKIFACASITEDGAQVSTNLVYQNGEKIEYCKRTNSFKSEVKSMSRKTYVQAIQNIPDNEPIIVLHYDTISEGINVPGFTGFMPFTDNLVKFDIWYQNLGRIIRLNKIDKKNLANGIITTDSYDGWIKPEAEIIIPYWNIKSDSAATYMANMMIELETNIGAHIVTQIPNSSDVQRGGNPPKIKIKISKDNKKRNIDGLKYEVAYSRELQRRKREEYLKGLKGMDLIERAQYFLNN